MPLLFCLIDCFSDIMAHIFIGKVNPLGCLVGFLSRLLQISSGRRDTKHTSAICDDIAILIEFRSGMETEIVVFSIKLFKTADFKSFFIGYRISVRRQYHTDCRIVLKLQINGI